jgi:hypothetical protein
MSLDTISGVQTASWGTPGITGFCNQDAELTVKAALKPTIKNEVGVVTTRGYGDMTTGIKINAIFSGQMPPNPGQTFQFSGLNWITDGDSQVKWKNDAWTAVSFDGIRSEGLAP